MTGDRPRWEHERPRGPEALVRRTRPPPPPGAAHVAPRNRLKTAGRPHRRPPPRGLRLATQPGACAERPRRRTCGNVAHGEQAHARVAVHRPLEGLAVGLAAVVHEARVVALGAGVDDAVLQRTTPVSRPRPGDCHRPETRRTAAVGLKTVVPHVHSDGTPPKQSCFSCSRRQGWATGSGRALVTTGRRAGASTSRQVTEKSVRTVDAAGREHTDRSLAENRTDPHGVGVGRQQVALTGPIGRTS